MFIFKVETQHADSVGECFARLHVREDQSIVSTNVAKFRAVGIFWELSWMDCFFKRYAILHKLAAFEVDDCCFAIGPYNGADECVGAVGCGQEFYFIAVAGIFGVIVLANRNPEKVVT